MTYLGAEILINYIALLQLTFTLTFRAQIGILAETRKANLEILHMWSSPE